MASLSTSFQDAGHTLFAFCEASPLLHAHLSLPHHDSLTALKSEFNEWKDWVFPPQGIVWLIGGPSCTSLSSAGRQLAYNDPKSRYLKDHINIAAACGALLILLENVPSLRVIQSMVSIHIVYNKQQHWAMCCHKRDLFTIRRLLASLSADVCS